jgi:hypothetical protein
MEIHSDDCLNGLQDNEDDLLYGDLSDAGAAASGKEAQTETQDQDKGEGAGEEDLELNLYEVGDKEDEDDSRSSSGIPPAATGHSRTRCGAHSCQKEKM